MMNWFEKGFMTCPSQYTVVSYNHRVHLLLGLIVHLSFMYSLSHVETQIP
jgi:hypothetical protein